MVPQGNHLKLSSYDFINLSDNSKNISIVPELSIK